MHCAQQDGYALDDSVTRRASFPYNTLILNTYTPRLFSFSRLRLAGARRPSIYLMPILRLP